MSLEKQATNGMHTYLYITRKNVNFKPIPNL